MNDKLRFLFISADQFPPFRVDVAVLFGEELVQRGHVIDWLLQSEEKCDIPYRTTWCSSNVWVGATNLGTSGVSRFRKHFYSIKNDLKMFGLVRKNKYDFIQVKDKFISALMAIVAARVGKIKFIYWLSWPFPEESLHRVRTGTARYPLFYLLRGWFFKILLYRIIMPSAAHVFVQSEQMKNDVIAMGIPKEKITAVPMGVSLREILCSPLDAGLDKIEQDEKVVLHLGSLSKIRKLDFLIRAFKKVLEKVPNAKLYFVGGGDNPDEVKDLKSAAAGLDIQDKVIFTGFIPREKAWNYVNRANVCVCLFYPTPILNSASPTKLVEYLALGKPVVANDHPEQKRVILESGAGICVPFEEKAFSDAIVELLNDTEKAKKMGNKGRHYVENYRSYKVIADKVEGQYLKVCTTGAYKRGEGASC